MRLLVFHYHDRAGGVREVIRRGLPLLLARMPEVREVVFLSGELKNEGWLRGLERSLGKVSFRCELDAGWGYAGGVGSAGGGAAAGVKERDGFSRMEKNSERHLREVLKGSPAGAGGGRTVLWAHNLSVGRNVPLLRALPGLCAEAGAELWLHHHDWWWDGRWARWPDWRAAGVDSLEQALAETLPTAPHVRHFCVNLADLSFLRAAAGDSARWVGNPLPDFRRPTAAEIRVAREWLHARSGGRAVWLAPVRALRRKNLAESLLLTRLLAPEACLVSTGGCGGSVEELPAWRTLVAAARSHGWPFAPSVLENAGPEAPGMPALLAASEAVVLTSLQEGFGLPWLEAAALERPLLSRWLPELAANLGASGCVLTPGPGRKPEPEPESESELGKELAGSAYRTLPVPRAFHNAAAEARRMRERGVRLCEAVPAELRRESRAFLEAETERRAEGAGGGLQDFGELSPEAQLEVLSGERKDFPLPPGIQPGVLDWPKAEAPGEAWAERFFSPAENCSAGPNAPAAQSAELRRRLKDWLRRPLLWPAV